jgi:internalin A
MYLNELRSSIERLITERWPGLGYRLWVPCSGATADGQQCKGRFPLDALARFRENGQQSTGCYECGELRDIGGLLTGFTPPSESLIVQLNDVQDQLAGFAAKAGGQLAEIASGIGGLTSQASELARQTARTADLVRRVLGFVAVEVTDCPRLFTLRRRDYSFADRLRLHQEHYELTLWCEHPGAEHPCAAATYNIDQDKKWFAEIAPYARLAVKTLQLAVPVAAALDLVALPTARRDDARARLDVMTSIIDDIPDITPDLVDRELALSEFADPRHVAGQLPPAEGQALRLVRRIIFEKDPNHAFGDLRRVQSPAGDLLWVCADHYREYDPGLPVLPVQD